jgi:MFS family permease
MMVVMERTAVVITGSDVGLAAARRDRHFFSGGLRPAGPPYTVARGDPSAPLRSGGSLALTPLQWLICAVACLGFAFDTYEITVFSIVARPSLASFGLHPGTAEFNRWVGLLLWLPQAAGGVVGLFGGYLTDRVGRRRVLVWSIVLYGVAAAGTALATSLPALLVWRCLTIAGACVEFVAAIAWLAEIFPEPRQREAVLGYTQAFSALGAFLVAGSYYVSITFGGSFPAIHGAHDAWRYTLLCGMLPAIPLMLVRPFLPESPVWRERRTTGTLSRPRLSSLFAPGLRRVTLVATLLAACSFGIAVGVIQQVPRVVPGTRDVRGLDPLAVERAVTAVHFFSNLGNVAGRLLFAWLVVRIAGQRRLLRLFIVPALLVTPLFFLAAPQLPLGLVKSGEFLIVTLMVAQLSFWGNYLPRMYPTHLRGTGESVATNIGGRLIGTSAAIAVTTLTGFMPGAAAAQLAYATACAALAIYAIAFVAVRWLPEPAAEALPE